MSAYTTVLRHYRFPFEFREDQIEDVCMLAPAARSGIFNDPGLGKTAVATAICFYKGIYGDIDQVLCLLPPILIDQWEEWLKNWPDISVQRYLGPPARRKKIDLEGDFILSTVGLFKNDFDRIMSHFNLRKTALLIDEATCIRQPDTGNFRAVRDFVDLPDKHLLMLTGTPLGAHPATAYGYIALKSPDLYGSYRRFKLIHVTREDQFDTPCAFQNLDLLFLL